MLFKLYIETASLGHIAITNYFIGVIYSQVVEAIQK